MCHGDLKFSQNPRVSFYICLHRWKLLREWEGKLMKTCITGLKARFKNYKYLIVVSFQRNNNSTTRKTPQSVGFSESYDHKAEKIPRIRHAPSVTHSSFACSSLTSPLMNSSRASCRDRTKSGSRFPNMRFPGSLYGHVCIWDRADKAAYEAGAEPSKFTHSSFWYMSFCCWPWIYYQYASNM